MNARAVLALAALCLAGFEAVQTGGRIQELEEIFLAQVIQLHPGEVARQVGAYQEPLAIEIAGERFVFEMEPRNLFSHGYHAEPTGPDQLLQGPDRKLRTTSRPPSAFGITCSLLPFSSVRGSSQMPQCLAKTISFSPQRIPTPADWRDRLRDRPHQHLIMDALLETRVAGYL